jgi:hypothetical protein
MNGEIPSTCSLNSSRNSSLIISDFQEQRSNPACPVGVAIAVLMPPIVTKIRRINCRIGLYEGLNGPYVYISALALTTAVTVD